jgi:hypothetical protein
MTGFFRKNGSNSAAYHRPEWIFDVIVKVEDEARVEREDEHCQE